MDQFSISELKLIVDQQQNFKDSLEFNQSQYSDALFFLGKAYNQGLKGEYVNIPLAIDYYQQAAKYNHVQAIYHLALAYDMGLGLVQDSSKAVEYYQIAAENGIARAQFNLAVHYSEGNGIDVDVDKAIFWYKEAADKGNVMQAQHNLAAIYAEGNLVPYDAEKCFHYYLLAATQGLAISQYRLGWCYANGVGCGRVDMHEAIKWYHKAANEGGNPQAQHCLGLCYDLGVTSGKENDANDVEIVVPVDKQRAVYYYFLAAQQGMKVSQLNLGVHLDNGDGVDEEDPQQATYWFYQAATGEDSPATADALLYLGHHYSDGRGVEKNMEQAVNFYTMAAQRGKVEAQAMMGWCCAVGEGMPQNKPDMKQSFAWYHAAASQGFVPAQYQLGNYYEQNLGLPRHEGVDENDEYAMKKLQVQSAMYWFGKAANENSFGPAMYSLGRLIATHGEEDADQNNDINLEEFELRRKTRNETASKYFRDCIRLGHLEGYVGLATVCNTEQEAVEYLVTAADNGVIEGWCMLCSNPRMSENEFLRVHWDSEKLAALMEVSNLMSQTNTAISQEFGSIQSDESQSLIIHDKDCAICQRDISTTLHFSTITGKSQIQPFRNHILPHAFMSIHHNDVDTSTQPDSIPITLDVLGSGGFGDVFKTHCKIPFRGTSNVSEQSTIIALKRIRSDNSLLRSNMMRDEMIKMKLLQKCPNIVQCYGHTLLSNSNHVSDNDFDDSDKNEDENAQNSFYLVMELAEYGDLDNVLYLMNNSPSLYQASNSSKYENNHNPLLSLTLPLIVKWMYQITSALHYMHRYFLKHLDLKPKNVLVFQGLNVKLTDFGISAKEDHVQKLIITGSVKGGAIVARDAENNEIRGIGTNSNSIASSAVDGNTTIDSMSHENSCSFGYSTSDSSSGGVTNGVTHTVAGTPGYMDPLMAEKGKLLESDIFSFGMTCVHIINQRKPNQSSWQRDFRTAMSEIQGLSPALAELVAQCCSMTLSVRPTAENCCESLDLIQQALPEMDLDVLHIFEEEIRLSMSE